MKKLTLQNSPKGTVIFDAETGLPNGGVPKEEKELIKKIWNTPGPHYMPPTLTQLKDEMEDILDDTIIDGGYDYNKEDHWISDKQAKERLSSHLQKTYEVAEKAGYEKARVELLSQIKAIGATCDDVDLVCVAQIINKLNKYE
jgi:hypothetical protein